MSWLTPTASSILDALPEEEATLYRTLDAGSEDRLETIIPRVVLMIRSKVRACTKNVMDPDDATIPPECEDALLAIIRHRLIAVLDVEGGANSDDPRVREYNDAKKYLDSLAACTALVTPGASGEKAGGVTLLSSRQRHDRRENLKGLV